MHANEARVPRVLVVDDEPLMRWSLSEMLADHGCDVVQAEDGRAARAAIRNGGAPIDVVLLDMRLPDCSGLELLSLLHHAAPSCRIILMSAYATPEIAHEAYVEGACDVMVKPFDMSAALAAVDRAV
jgi:DNA-binding NtrC family response regulator